MDIAWGLGIGSILEILIFILFSEALNNTLSLLLHQRFKVLETLIKFLIEVCEILPEGYTPIFILEIWSAQHSRMIWGIGSQFVVILPLFSQRMLRGFPFINIQIAHSEVFSFLHSSELRFFLALLIFVLNVTGHCVRYNKFKIL